MSSSNTLRRRVVAAATILAASAPAGAAAITSAPAANAAMTARTRPTTSLSTIAVTGSVTADSFTFVATGKQTTSTVPWMVVDYVQSGQAKQLVTDLQTGTTTYTITGLSGLENTRATVFNEAGVKTGATDVLTVPWTVTGTGDHKSIHMRVASPVRPAPDGSWAVTTWTQGGATRTNVTGLDADGSTAIDLSWIEGWSNASTKVYDRNGTLMATSATINPPVPTTSTPPPVPAPSSIGRPGGIGAFLHNDPNRNNLSDITHADYVVLHANQYAQIPTIKAANPRAKVYFYSNASAYSKIAGTTPGSFQPNVVTRTQAEANPSWSLKTTNGQTYAWSDFNYLQPMDIANDAYIDAAIKNTTNELNAHGWDGVMLDDVNYSDSGHANNGTPYFASMGSTNREAAMTKFLSKFSPAVKTNTGKEITANVQQDWNHYDSQIKAWAPYLDVFVFEHASLWGENRVHTMTTTSNTGDYQDEAMARYRLAEADLVSSLGKRQMSLDYLVPTDTNAARYHRAMFLMGWDGVTESTSMISPGRSSADSFYTPAADIDLGKPTNKRVEIAANVYKRIFERGTLYLNANKRSVVADGITISPDGVAVR